MQADPFGNLKDWGPVLELLCQLSDEGKLSECQHGLTRILAYRDNWRLREETLKRIGTILKPSDEMIRQVLKIIADEKLYYEVRILACETMEELMKNSYDRFGAEVETTILKTIKELLSMQHPPIFVPALKRLYPIALEKFSIV